MVLRFFFASLRLCAFAGTSSSDFQTVRSSFQTLLGLEWSKDRHFVVFRGGPSFAREFAPLYVHKWPEATRGRLALDQQQRSLSPATTSR